MISYEDAIQDININKVSSSILKKYKRQLNKYELDQCKHIGIWKACQKYDVNQGRLTTYICNRINWECLKLIKSNQSNFVDKRTGQENGIRLFKQLELILSRLEYDVLQKKYLYNMTIKEIASEMRLSVFSTRKMLSESLYNAKKALL